MVLHTGDRSDFGGYVLSPRGTSDLQDDPPWQGTGSITDGLSVRAQPAPRSAPRAARVRLMFPRGVGLLPAAHQQNAYLQLSCHMDGKHVHCFAAKMSKNIKAFLLLLLLEIQLFF